MNTLLMLPALFASDGGIERILRLYVRAVGELTPAGAQVHALILNDTQLDEAGLAPYRTPALSAPIACGRNKLAYAWHAIRLGRQSQRVICGHLNLLRLAHLARRFSRDLEVWLVAHGIEVWREFSAPQRAALTATHRILCVSDYTRRQILQRCPGLPPERLLVQPNALDPQFELASIGSTVRPEAGLILAVARLNSAEAYKGIDHLIAALPAIHASDPHARLRIVGDGDDRPRLEALAAKNHVHHAVEFAGRVSDKALRDHFAACQLFALPSRGEGFGLVYLEAMAHGKPCLAADAGGAPEVVTAETGMLVPFGDVAAIAGACRHALRREWSADALRTRARHFSFAAFKQRLLSLSA